MKVKRDGMIIAEFQLNETVHPIIISGNTTAPHAMKNILSFLLIRPALPHIQQTTLSGQPFYFHADYNQPQAN